MMNKAIAIHGEQFSKLPDWEQNFTRMPDGSLDNRFWNIVTSQNGLQIAGYNHEAEAYTDHPRNVRIENGLLVLEAVKQNYEGRHYTSARINTQGKFDFTHGKLEADMRLPAGRGTWPAFWLLPDHPRYNQAKYGVAQDQNFGWLLNGEIDIMEAIGAEPNLNQPDAHTYSARKTDQFTKAVPVKNMYQGFHRYGLEKTPASLIFTLDGMAVYEVKRTSDDPKKWPYEQPYYPILNLAIGGDWANQKGIDNSSAPWKLEVKSVRYYHLI